MHIQTKFKLHNKILKTLNKKANHNQLKTNYEIKEKNIYDIITMTESDLPWLEL